MQGNNFTINTLQLSAIFSLCSSMLEFNSIGNNLLQ